MGSARKNSQQEKELKAAKKDEDPTCAFGRLCGLPQGRLLDGQCLQWTHMSGCVLSCIYDYRGRNYNSCSRRNYHSSSRRNYHSSSTCNYHSSSTSNYHRSSTSNYHRSSTSTYHSSTGCQSRNYHSSSCRNYHSSSCRNYHSSSRRNYYHCLRLRCMGLRRRQWSWLCLNVSSCPSPACGLRPSFVACELL